ncbi:hypothetical protein [Streptomyces sp. AcH 505]
MKNRPRAHGRTSDAGESWEFLSATVAELARPAGGRRATTP